MDNTSLSLKQRFRLSRFFKGESAISGPIVLNQRRVFILPTKTGLGMVLTISLLLMIAFVYNNNLAYLLGFMLASVFFVGILHTFKGLAGLVVQAGYAPPVFAGEPAAFSITITNPDQQSRPALSAKLETEHLFDLGSGEAKTLILYASTRTRGWQMIDTLTLTCSYPLGIFRAWSPLRLDGKVLVYPQPCSVSLPFPVAGGEEQSGPRHVVRSGRDEFNGIRSYQAGDPLRQIHWKAYAKGQGLFSKHYANQIGGSDLWLDYDVTPGSHAEERISQLCRWVVDAEIAGLRYGLSIPGRKIAPDRGAKHYAACLEALALI